jgi:outer membrane protein assembly factor BamB
MAMQERTVRARTLWKTPGPQPNGLQAAEDGLWVLDQGDDKIYVLDYDTGRPLKVLECESVKGSGITLEGGHVWLASTYDCQIIKADRETGATIAKFDTPGAGVVPWATNPNQPRTGAHGLEWRDGTLWVATPPSGTIYVMDPTDGHVIRSFKAAGYRPHGLAWQDGYLWCVETNDRALYKHDPETGEMLEKVVIDGPEPHGMTIRDGVFWYCDAHTCEVAVVEL